MRSLAPLFLIAGAWAADARIEQTPDALRVAMDGEVQLSFPLRDGRLLGLGEARVGAVQLSRPGFALAPVLAEEYGPKPWVSAAWTLQSAKPAAGGGVELTLGLLASESDAARRAVFVIVADEARVLTEGMTPELSALKAKAEAAAAAIAAAVEQRPELVEALGQKAKLAAEAKPDKKALGNLDKQIAKLRSELVAPTIAAAPALRAADAERSAWKAALQKRGLEFGRIHRDYYEFAQLQQPADFCKVEALTALAAQPAAPGGTLVWTLKPASRTVAGWTWTGWEHSYRFQLADGRKVTALRQLATWAMGGDLAGNTVVNLRYRGLGSIEQGFSAAADGGVKECFSTTEIIPGAVDGTPVISPAIPVARDMSDRGYGLKHRAGAWICRPARGAGVSALDFMFRPEAAYAHSFDRADAIRSLSEAFPGDRVLSHSDEHLFPLGAEGATRPEQHLVLAAPQKLHEWRTRWSELNRELRDRHAAELGMTQYEARPAAGANIDSGWDGNLKTLSGNMDVFAAAGVKMLYVHHPGWWNGRQREPGQPAVPSGGDCAIWDWKPLSAAQEPWKQLQRKAAANSIGYHIWITGMSVKDAAFFNEVGSDLKHWAINAPGKQLASGYPPHLFNHNILDPRFKEVFLKRMADLRRDYGFQGFWADSFQNLFMSTLDWANGTGAPMQRAWWEQIAAWSKDGLAWTSESHSMPGLSCSIEVVPTDNDCWYFEDVVRWYRADLQDPGQPSADRRLFRTMAAKGWLAPQVGYGRKPAEAFPTFASFAAAYEAALPSMRRKYNLPEERGVLWLPYGGDGEGVIFAFSEQDAPAGVEAAPILGGAANPKLPAQTVQRVKAKDLLAAYGLARGPAKDERLGRSWTMPTHTWPAW
jgi:hypothetical protein